MNFSSFFFAIPILQRCQLSIIGNPFLFISSSRCTNSIDSFDSPFPSSPINYHSRQVLYTASTELINESFCCSANTGVPMCWSLLENIAYEFSLTSLACLTWMVNEMGGKWPYCCCIVECCF